jgi:transcriptional regulator with XRE-family HTH domain
VSKYELAARVKGRLRAQGKLIGAARRARSFTQAELAKRAGTSRPTINRLESGNANVAWGTVLTICWLLDIPSDPDLMDPVRRAELLTVGKGVQRASGVRNLDDDF